MTPTVAAIDGVLHALTERVQRTAHGRWVVWPTSTPSIVASAYVDGDWLELASELARPAPLWSMLAWNAILPGGACFAARPAGGFVVRADVALDAGPDLDRRVGDAFDGLRLGIACVHEQRAHGAVAPAAGDAGTLGAWCRSTGWPVRERPQGTFAVDLEVPGAPHQALVERRSDGRASASVRVLDPGEDDARMSPVCRQALGVLLVRVSGAVRMVRAAADSDADAAPRIEVVTEAPTPEGLGHAFAALSVACRLVAREAAVLRNDETVARAYVRQCEDGLARRAA